MTGAADNMTASVARTATVNFIERSLASWSAPTYLGAADNSAKLKLNQRLASANRTDEIHLAQFDARVSQDVVSGCTVEVDVGQHEYQQIVPPVFHAQCSLRKLQLDGAGIGTFEFLRLDTLHVRDGLIQTCLEFRESALGIGKLRRLDA